MTPEQRLLIKQVWMPLVALLRLIGSTYRIALLDKPTIVWDFYSLMRGIQIMLSVMLTDSDKPISICKHCMQTFVANRPSDVFCGPQCKNKYNVYKTRGKNKDKEGDTNA